jgi:hypothetical protein
MKRLHFAFSGVAQGSSVNENSLSSSSKNACGVAHSSVALENIAEFIIFASENRLHTDTLRNAMYNPCRPQWALAGNTGYVV